MIFTANQLLCMQSFELALVIMAIFQFVLLSCLFALWGAAASLNDILITQFKSVFTLSDFASALVQSAFYGGYFLISIPASVVIRKTTYKLAIMIGLIFYIGGCSLYFSQLL